MEEWKKVLLIGSLTLRYISNKIAPVESISIDSQTGGVRNKGVPDAETICSLADQVLWCLCASSLSSHSGPPLSQSSFRAQKREGTAPPISLPSLPKPLENNLRKLK